MAYSFPNGQTIHPPQEIRCRWEVPSSMHIEIFGSSTASNVLDYFKGTPEITTSVITFFIDSVFY